jgi:hypothetical protein
VAGDPAGQASPDERSDHPGGGEAEPGADLDAAGPGVGQGAGGAGQRDHQQRGRDRGLGRPPGDVGEDRHGQDRAAAAEEPDDRADRQGQGQDRGPASVLDAEGAHAAPQRDPRPAEQAGRAIAVARWCGPGRRGSVGPQRARRRPAPARRPRRSRRRLGRRCRARREDRGSRGPGRRRSRRRRRRRCAARGRCRARSGARGRRRRPGRCVRSGGGRRWFCSAMIVSTKSKTSDGRSRSGGIRTGITRRRYMRSARNRPASTSARSARWGRRHHPDVDRDRLAGPPTGKTVRLSSTRRSLACSSSGSSATSSRNSVPPSASWTWPGVSLIAPVNAPLAWPNSSLSSRLAGRAAQLRARNGPAARAEQVWRARATSSLPEPVSPRTQHGLVARRHARDDAEQLFHPPVARPHAMELHRLALVARHRRDVDPPSRRARSGRRGRSAPSARGPARWCRSVAG